MSEGKRRNGFTRPFHWNQFLLWFLFITITTISLFMSYIMLSATLSYIYYTLTIFLFIITIILCIVVTYIDPEQRKSDVENVIILI